MATINFYSKEQIDTLLDGYQPDLTEAQLNAVNSGITAAKVSTYDGYASLIAAKQDALSQAQLNAVNSGITAAKVTQYDGYASEKQDKITITLTDNSYYTITY